jgi:hypothetical protein
MEVCLSLGSLLILGGTSQKTEWKVATLFPTQTQPTTTGGVRRQALASSWSTLQFNCDGMYSKKIAATLSSSAFNDTSYSRFALYLCKTAKERRD